MAEQRRIAAILRALDDKIGLNRRMAATLEAMARHQFRWWFGAGPGHNGVIQGRSGTLADVSDLSPETWPPNRYPDAIRYVDLAGAKAGHINEVVDYLGDTAPSRAQRVLRPGDTIVGTVRPGNRSYALVTLDGLTGSTGFAHLRPRNPRDGAFVYLAATGDWNIERLAHLADGAAYPAVRPAVVSATEIQIPDDGDLDRFSRTVEPLLARAAHADAESRALAAVRDMHLPRLMSGAFDALGTRVA